MIDKESLATLGILAGIGVVAGMGRLLASAEKLTTRLVFGRAIASAGLGAAAATILAFMPLVPFIAQCGIAAAIASLGTSGLERIFQKYFGRQNDGE